MEATQNSAPNQTTERGRPAKNEKKLTRSINLKLTEADYKIVVERTSSVGMKATPYAWRMALCGEIISRYTKKELDLRHNTDYDHFRIVYNRIDNGLKLMTITGTLLPIRKQGVESRL